MIVPHYWLCDRVAANQLPKIRNMPRYQRLKDEDIQPVGAAIPRDTARRLLVDYLMQALRWPRTVAESAIDPFDLIADEQDQKADDAFENAVSDPSLEVETATDEANDLHRELSQCSDPKETKALQAELAKVEKSLARNRAKIEKAEAKRAAAKGDYRKALLKAAQQIVSEEERM